MNVQTAIRPNQNELLGLAREEAYSTPLREFHPGAHTTVPGRYAVALLRATA